MKNIRCARCGRILTEDMEIECSTFLKEYFCNPDCATDYYFEYMGSKPLDKENLDIGTCFKNKHLKQI